MMVEAEHALPHCALWLAAARHRIELMDDSARPMIDSAPACTRTAAVRWIACCKLVLCGRNASF